MGCAARRTQGARDLGLAPWVLFFAVVATATAAMAHPTVEDLIERARVAALCSRAANPGEAFDPVGLGAPEAQLRTTWGDALQARPIEHLDPDFHRLAQPPRASAEPDSAANTDPYAEQIRLRRTNAEGDIRSVEYELFRGRVYRIRWELSERFFAPIMDDVIHQADHCYGAPEYDQTLVAKIASGEATFRRAGWRRDDRLLEIRQLNPLLGGPVFVTITDMDASQAIITARGSLAPEPDRRTQPWWLRSGTTQELPSDEERGALARAIAAVLSQTEF